MRDKKGISPLIATVLLIGFTIVLAALVMRWGTGLLEGTTETQECLSLARIGCTEVDFSLSVISADYNNCNIGSCEINLTVRNNGAKEIDHLIFIGMDVNGATTQIGGELFSITDDTTTIDSFDSHTFTFNFTDRTQMAETVAIEVIPSIVHEPDDGSPCGIDCTEKSSTYRNFDWVA